MKRTKETSGWRWRFPAGLGVALLAGAIIFSAASAPARVGKGSPMPEFTSSSPGRWLNSPPLKKADLKGKVVLLEIWTSI